MEDAVHKYCKAKLKERLNRKEKRRYKLKLSFLTVCLHRLSVLAMSNNNWVWNSKFEIVSKKLARKNKEKTYVNWMGIASKREKNIKI